MSEQAAPIPRVLVVDDDEFALENLVLALSQAGALVRSASSAHQALRWVGEEYFHVVVSDVKMPGMDGITFIEKVKQQHSTTKFVVVTGYADDDAVIRALRLGVNEFLKKPYRDNELLIAVQKLLELHELEEENRKLQSMLSVENDRLRAELEQVQGPRVTTMIGKHESLEQIRSIAERVARFGINAMIIGENGSGKELVAQTIKERSPRADKPFIAVNCAALSATLFESELFGYEKGAFTGAQRTTPGLFELADGGIIFLDEVTEVPTAMQAKLLRVLETGVIRRVGGQRDIKIDVQVLSATNRDPKTAIADGVLRQDVYHRLATIEINVPPLRDRASDIPILVNHFLDRFAKHFNAERPELTTNEINELILFPWPGNIRQLSNIMKQWVLFGAEVALKEINDPAHRTQRGTLPSVMRYDFVLGTIDEVEDAKTKLIRTLMSRYNGNKSAVARHAGLSYPGLHKLLKRIGADEA